MQFYEHQLFFLPEMYASYSCYLYFLIIVKPGLSGHLKIDKTKVLMVNSSVIKVKSIAEPWSILQIFLTCIKRYLELKANFWCPF